MARIRNIKPDFFMSEDIGYLTVTSRLLYIALWGHADRDGKMKFRPTALKAQCLPFEMDKFDDCLAELCQEGHVVKYEVKGKKYLYLPTLSDHQTFHKTEKTQNLPDPDNGEVTVKPPLDHGEEGEGEGEGNKKDNNKLLSKKRRSRIPDDWQLTKADREKAVKYWWTKNRKDIDPDEQAELFIAHHLSKGSAMLDWSAAWQTWYCNAIKFNPEKRKVGMQI